MIFEDFTKGYYSVNRKVLYNILIDFNITDFPYNCLILRTHIYFQLTVQYTVFNYVHMASFYYELTIIKLCYNFNTSNLLNVT
jgi:hypothetical protein